MRIGTAVTALTSVHARGLGGPGTISARESVVGGVVCDGRNAGVSVCGFRVVRQRLVMGRVEKGGRNDESEDERLQLWSVGVGLLGEGGTGSRLRLWTGF